MISPNLVHARLDLHGNHTPTVMHRHPPILLLMQIDALVSGAMSLFLRYANRLPYNFVVLLVGNLVRRMITFERLEWLPTGLCLHNFAPFIRYYAIKVGFDEAQTPHEPYYADVACQCLSTQAEPFIHIVTAPTVVLLSQTYCVAQFVGDCLLSRVERLALLVFDPYHLRQLVQL